jgi:hypothetical protein
MRELKGAVASQSVNEHHCYMLLTAGVQLGVLKRRSSRVSKGFHLVSAVARIMMLDLCLQTNTIYARHFQILVHPFLKSEIERMTESLQLLVENSPKFGTCRCNCYDTMTYKFVNTRF